MKCTKKVIKRKRKKGKGNNKGKETYYEEKNR